jgi:adenylate cyclase
LSVVLVGAFVSGSLLVWHQYQLPVHLTGGLLTIVVVFTANSVVRYVAEGRAKNEIRSIFSRYVHPDVIETLTRHPNQIVMGGDLVNASILFTDIADFTTYAETRRADVLVPELNAYLSVLTESVLDEGGLLDKFTGDGIMALYGVPLHTPDHAVQACRTALRHLAFTQSLRPESASESDLFFHQHTRIGINSGDIIAGNIGSSRRMDFTAIGDDVNLAARLEGVNKVYGTRIIIGEATRAQIGDMFVVRELDSITVKGKANPIRIFELVAEVGTPETISWIRDYEEGLLWYRQGDWSLAEHRFVELAARHPADKASAVMADRCMTLRNLSPSDWDGVYRIQSK